MFSRHESICNLKDAGILLLKQPNNGVPVTPSNSHFLFPFLRRALHDGGGAFLGFTGYRFSQFCAVVANMSFKISSFMGI